MNAPDDLTCEDGVLLPDLFHALSQPLTSLHCCLELCLRPANRLDKRIRQNLRVALQQAESIILLVSSIQVLVDTRAVEAIPEEINFGEFLHEMSDVLSSLAEAGKKDFFLVIDECGPVNIAANRLYEVLFRVTEFAIRQARAHTSVKLSANRKDNAVVLTIRFTGRRSAGTTASTRRTCADRELQDRLHLAIARRIVAGGGGVLRLGKHSNRYAIEVRLPTVAREPALPLTRRLRRLA